MTTITANVSTGHTIEWLIFPVPETNDVTIRLNIGMVLDETQFVERLRTALELTGVTWLRPNDDRWLLDLDGLRTALSLDELTFLKGSVGLRPDIRIASLSRAVIRLSEALIRHWRDADREREPKFGILWSARQAGRDFELWTLPAAGGARGVVVAFLDVDKFKALNTRYTETIVDRDLLPVLQAMLNEAIGTCGGAYLQGGDEFLVILPGASVEAALDMLDEIRNEFGRHAFSIAGQTERLTVSIGLARSPDHGSSFAEVLAAANWAEHDAKNAGGNVVRVARA